MKKIFSLFAAVLMAGSMMAGVEFQWNMTATAAPAAGTTAADVYYGTTDASKAFSVESVSYNADVPEDMKSNSGKGIKMGSNALYLKIEGDFRAGDTVFVCGYNPWKVSSTTAFAGDLVASIATGTSKTDYNVGYGILTADADSLFFNRVEGTGTCAAAIKVVRPESAPAPVINYWLVGTAAANGWDQTKAMPMDGDSIVRSLAAGTYEFKVLVAEGSWNGALGYSNVNTECSSEGYENNGGNVKVTLNEAGDLKVKVVGGQICVTGAFGQAVVTVYTIAGESALMGANWAPAEAANDMTNNEGTWTLVKTGVELAAKNYEYKVVGNHAWGVADFPASGNKSLTIAEAGTYDVTFTWIPAENSLTAVAQAVEAGWDGTVTLSKTTFTSLADLEGLQLTFNGATSVDIFDDEEAAGIIFQNEDGSNIYAAWGPAYGGTSSISGNVVTLNGWYTGAEPLPTTSGSVYFEDYGNFIIDGEDEYFETIEAYFEAAPAVTYTVTYTVTGAVTDEAAAQAGYYNLEEDGAAFVAGANTVPENMIAYVYAQMIEGYTVEVKVNGAAVTLTDGYWEGAINADMTIDVTFIAPEPENPWASVYTSNVTFTAGTNSYLTDKINIGETEYAAFKIGKSSAGGSCSVTLPAGTKEFHFHAICWSKTADTDLNITGAYTETVKIKAANISGNSPYTFDLDYADPTQRYYNHIFETPLAAAATVTFTCDYRAVFFGVNVVTETTTAVENVEAAKAVKVIENGQVVIIREGVRYNVAGLKL